MIFSLARVHAGETRKDTTMTSLLSKDGTRIAFDRTGQGPPVIIVAGAFNDRSTGAPLAAFLAARFTVFTYDRRGRGDSGDTAPYDVEREIEDLGALLAEAGGSAFVLGFSSGAVLALKAAARGLPITKLALHEAPLGAPTASAQHAGRLSQMIAAGRPGEAVEYFQAKVVGIPWDVVARLRQAPFRPALERMAPTLVYECLIMGDGSLGAAPAASVEAPTLVTAGGASAPFMRETAQALAAALPRGQAAILEAQGHDLEPAVLGPVLERFFDSPRGP
jgi:pimeloyl-ACP methyl ester carboxylesterase